MAFDRNNPEDLAALKTEITTDPTGLGYAAAPNLDTALDLINNPIHIDPPVLGQDFATARRILKSIYPEPISSQDQFKVQLLFEGSDGMNSDLSEFKPELSALSGGIATAIASITRNLSRAEILFSVLNENGVNERVVISQQDWIAARDS